MFDRLMIIPIWGAALPGDIAGAGSIPLAAPNFCRYPVVTIAIENPHKWLEIGECPLLCFFGGMGS